MAKINPRDLKTRKLVLPLENFRKLMGIKRTNVRQLQDTADKLLQHIITIEDENGSFDKFQLFKRCKVLQEKKGSTWYFEIDAHDESLHLMFDYKKEYFKFKLIYTLQLDGPNKVRLYELLKQYEKLVVVNFTVERLKELIGIESNKYKLWSNFSAKVLKPCQKAFAKYTDIKFDYKPIRKGFGGKIIGLEITILSNKKYIEHMNDEVKELIEFDSSKIELQDINLKYDNNTIKLNSTNLTPRSKQKHLVGKNKIELESDPIDIDGENTLFNFSDDDKNMLFEVCNREFTEHEMDLLIEIASQSLVFKIDEDRRLSIHNYFKKKYKELCYRDSKNPIKHRFAYFKKLLEVGKIKLEAEEQLKELETSYESRGNNYNLERKPSYDLEAYENDNVFLEKQLGKFENLA